MNRKLQMVFAEMFSKSCTILFSRDSDRWKAENNYVFSAKVICKNGDTADYIAMLEMSECGSQIGLSSYSICKDKSGKEVRNFFDWKEVL